MKSFLILLATISLMAPAWAGAAETPAAEPAFVSAMAKFPEIENAHGLHSIAEKISYRAAQQPFLLVATVIFVLAILHTFFAAPITRLSHRAQQQHNAKILRSHKSTAADTVSFKATMLHFLGEVEAIFGIWGIVLMAAMAAFYDLGTVKSYIMGVNFTEPMFVVVIMALASTRPILRFAESCLGRFAKLGKQTPAAWWLSILIVAPLLGSLITEPGAMTIAALLLAKKF